LNECRTQEIMLISRNYNDRYPSRYKIIQIIQLFPYSNAEVERDFSQLDLIKTATRNRIEAKNLEACLLIKQESSQVYEDLFSKGLILKLRSEDLSKSAVITSQPITTSKISHQPSSEEMMLEEEKIPIESTKENTAQPDTTVARRKNPVPMIEKEHKKRKLASEASQDSEEESIKSGILAIVLLVVR